MTVSERKSNQNKNRSPKAAAAKVPAAPLTRVGVKEFRDKATQLLAQDMPFAVERHGKVIGFYTPLGLSDEQKQRAAVAAEHLENTMQKVAQDMGLSLEALEELLVGDLP